MLFPSFPQKMLLNSSNAVQIVLWHRLYYLYASICAPPRYRISSTEGSVQQFHSLCFEVTCCKPRALWDCSSSYSSVLFLAIIWCPSHAGWCDYFFYLKKSCTSKIRFGLFFFFPQVNLPVQYKIYCIRPVALLKSILFRKWVCLAISELGLRL